MDKSLLFDTGPLISLATNNLLWILRPLRQAFNGKFYITQAAKYELIDHPLATKRFKFEALQVLELIKTGTLEILDSPAIKSDGLQMLDSANRIYTQQKQPIIIVQHAEMQTVAAAVRNQSASIVVDERTTRLLLEAPHVLKTLLGNKMDVKVEINHDALAQFRSLVGKTVPVMRSAELVTIAYELGILDKFLADIKDARRTLLESVLWGVKVHGCSIANREIEQVLKLEKV